MITKDNFQQEMFTKCLDEMYRNSQPPISWEELLKQSKEHPEEPLYEQHYLSNEESKYIIDKYIDLYNLEDQFKRDCDIIIRDMQEGCSRDKYIKPNGDIPGYRSYEKVPPLSEIIGEEVAQKVINFIKERKDFYKFNRKCENFFFTMFNYSPCSNKDTVIGYWDAQGVELEIKDSNPEYFYEKYYMGLTDEQIAEEIKWSEENE